MTNQGSVGKAQRRVLFAMSFIAIFALLSVTFAVLLLIPYKPMQIYSYALDESEVCLREPVEVYIEYELAEGINVISIEAESAWIAVDVPGIAEGQQVGGLEGTLIPAPPNEVITGVLPRIAPPNVGEWQLGSEVTVRGMRYGFLPYAQRLEVQASEITTVLPSDSEKCTRGGEN